MSSSLAQALLSSLPENLRAQASGAGELGGGTTVGGDMSSDAAGASGASRSGGGGGTKRVRGSSMMAPAGSFDLGDPMGVSFSTYAPLGHGGRRQSIGARDSFYLHDAGGSGGAGGGGVGFVGLHRRTSEDVRPSGIDLGFGGGGGGGGSGGGGRKIGRAHV